MEILLLGSDSCECLALTGITPYHGLLAISKESAFCASIASTVKWLVVGSLGLKGFYYIRELRKRNRALSEIGPFGTASNDKLSMEIQRSIINATRVELKASWYPGDSLLDYVPKRSQDNGHKISGEVRDAARSLIYSAVSSSGRAAHEIAPTSITQPETVEHRHYAPSDLSRPISSELPPKESVVVMIDVDHFIEDWTYVLGGGNTVVMHGFNPVEVSGTDGDSVFTIKDDVVEYRVGGGGVWQHRVWNWCESGEFIQARAHEGWLTSIFGYIGVGKHYIHKVHHARPWKECPNRVLVWLVPQYSYWKVDWLPADMFVRDLQRVKYSVPEKPGWNRIVYDSSDGSVINFGRAGEDVSITLPKSTMDVVLGCSSSQAVTTYLINLKYLDPTLTRMVGQYYNSKIVVSTSADRVSNPIDLVRVHWPSACSADEIEVSGRWYSSPLVENPNLLPMKKRWDALSDTIEQRVTIHKNTKRPSARIQSYATEFVRLVVREVGTGVPFTLDETAVLLDKPSQKIFMNQVWESMDSKERKLIEGFIKNEPTNKSGRIISSFADFSFIWRFSCFTLAFRNAILHDEENSHWFCPGLTPREIADKVVEYVGQIEEPCEGDFQNFDGLVSDYLQRAVINACYLRFFHPTYHQELIGYLNMLISCPARAKTFYFRYDAGVGVKSGSPTTCDGNSILNAFLQFSAIRMTYPEQTPIDAFRHIGLAFGDDSLFERKYARNFAKVAESVGMVLKVEYFKPENGLTFLARVFIDPYTTNTTIQDPLRTWRKIHMTTRDPTIPLADAAVDRVEGYLVIDPLTPVTSDYCRMIVRLYGPQILDEAKRGSRKSRNREKSYWASEPTESWPQHLADTPLMLSVISARTGIDEAGLNEMIARLRSVESVWFGEALEVEEDNPYRNTLMPDGQLPPAGVDLRIHQNELHRNNQNALDQSRTKAGGAGSRDNQPIRNVTADQLRTPRDDGRARGSVDVSRGLQPRGTKPNPRKAPPPASARAKPRPNGVEEKRFGKAGRTKTRSPE